jgi:wyosine [tRNA(Phe)-imidazoG37] synthetase (radical SAM superfamily)
MRAFGPVPSRRLGQSLGINNIPPKVCTYSCVYCQLGPTAKTEMQRQSFYPPEEIAEEVSKKVEASKKLGQTIDYLTFVPDGEPTLDKNLGREIELLRPLGCKIAVITNASLIDDESVRRDLNMADWVSLKIDAAEEKVWKKINCPHRSLSLEAIKEGMMQFSRSFSGTLSTETMLIKDTNDDEQNLKKIADFLARLGPSIAYISVPIRPPAKSWALPPTEEKINLAYHIFKSRLEHVELLVGYEGDAFASTGDLANDILSITAVHPMREDAMRKLIARAGSSWEIVQALIDEGQLKATAFKGNTFYLRKPKAPPLDS